MHNSEEQFRQLADSIPQLAWMADSSGWLYWYNQRWYDFTGTTFAEMEGWGWQNVHHPDYIEEISRTWQEVLKTGENWEATFPLRAKNGEYRWFLTRAYAIRDSNGAILRWFGTNTDITERLEAEETLRATEAFTRSILEASPDCIAVVNREGCLLSMNESGQRALEIDDFSRFFLKSWSEQWPEQSRPSMNIALADAKAGKVSRFEAFCPTARNTPKWWEVIITPIQSDNNGKLDKILCISRDITQRKKIETALQEALNESQKAHDKVVEISNRKDEFLANMSHELRTPLNAIIGIGHILARTSPQSPKQATCINTLQASSESLLVLINDLLDLAKLETRNVQLERIPFYLRELVEEIAAMSLVVAQQKNITLQLNFDERLEGRFLGDPHRLRQILNNLTSNAVKFTEAGGVSITVSFQSEMDDKVIVMFKIEDTGIGIPKDKLQDVFSKFSQADSSTSRRYGGTGLGLAISKTLADLMGAEITVESQQGVGSRFMLRLPLPRDDGSSSRRLRRVFSLPLEQVSTSSVECNNEPYVLIVEDYQPNLLVASTYMEMLGYRFDTASNGEEALAKIKEHRYDVILMDVQMPGMDGLEATQAIRAWEKKHKRERTPIIGVTAHALSGDREKCIEAGMDEYLSKPYSPEVIKQMIDAERCDLVGV